MREKTKEHVPIDSHKEGLCKPIGISILKCVGGSIATAFSSATLALVNSDFVL